MTDYANDPDLEPSEQIRQPFGTCDGVTLSFSGYCRTPIVPGSVVVRVISDDAISQMALLEDPHACYASAHDITKDGILHGKISVGSVAYETGQVTVGLFEAPPPGYRLEIIWRRYIHKRRAFMIEIINPESGEKFKVPINELHRITRFY